MNKRSSPETTKQLGHGKDQPLNNDARDSRNGKSHKTPKGELG
ncbi:MAG: hypothetical protein WBR29_10395 [Gammaproteobacteria bacterium]